MWAFIRTLSYSLEANINKRLINKQNVVYYLANKFWVGLLLLPIVFFSKDIVITTNGIYLMGLVCFILALNQFIAFSGLARIKLTTNIIVKQIRIVFMLIISFILGTMLTTSNILGSILVMVGVILVINLESKETTNKKDSLVGLIIAIFSSLSGVANSFLLNYGLQNNMFSSNLYSVMAILTIVLLFNITNIFKNKEDKVSFSKKEFWLLQLSGVLSVMVNVSRAFAIETVGVFTTEIVGATAPALIYLMAIAIKLEKFTLKRGLGILIVIAGIITSLI